VAPVGAWLAIGALSLRPSCWRGPLGRQQALRLQDVEFDRREGLRSLPASLGVPRALALARLMHVGTVLALLLLFGLVPLHPLYLAGVPGVAVILAWEHSLVRPADLSQVMRAFNLNGWVSLGYFGVTAVSAWLVPR
jgi:4-hydroxybenzoate polyprenyltransferase